MLSHARILVVDDDASTTAAVQNMLKKLGAAHVTVCSSGLEAFAAVTKTRDRFDCVIADVRMPEGNGLELLYQIRTATVARNFRPDMCIVLMSGVASVDIASVARELDVNAFLVKPFTIHALHKAISLARRRVPPLDQARYAQIGASALQVA